MSILVVFLTLTGAALSASTDAVEDVKILGEIQSINGDCTEMYVSSSGSDWTDIVFLDELLVQTTPETGGATRTCTFAVPLLVAPQVAVTVTRVSIQGTAEISPGGMGAIGLTHGLKNSRTGRNVSLGPIRRYFSGVQDVRVTSEIGAQRTACSSQKQEVSLVVSIVLGVRRRLNSTEQSFLGLDRLSGAIQYRIVAENCSL